MVEYKSCIENFGDEEKKLINLMATNMLYPFCSKKGKIFFRGPKGDGLSDQRKEEIITRFSLKTKKDCVRIREIIKMRASLLRPNEPIKEWLEDERPRETLAKNGPKNLSDTELLAIILRMGSPGASAVDLARAILKKFGSLRKLDSVSVAEFQSVDGVGVAKAAQIKAALEIGKRFLKEKTNPKKKIKTVEDVVNYFQPYLRDLKKEIFKALLLDGRNKILSDVTISEGSLSKSVVHPREAVKEAIKESAAAVIFVHNHPSGDPNPTEDDIEITKELIEACRLMKIRVLDHIIIGDNSYISFVDEGLMEES